ncbi:MAG: BamA/TamA family outer membrane protein, partial [Chitinophagales bacterium]
IVRRVILIGDAGEMNNQQQAIVANAASRILADKTTVFYLGNNIFPKGMKLQENSEDGYSQQILQSQYQPMRSKGAAVYFIPGNYDWDRSGKDGLGKIKKQWAYIQGQNDPLLQFVPANACPDPVEINVSDELAIIAFDSEWWLFPFSNFNPNGNCDCTSKDEILARLEELFYKNRFKVILLASHHPFQSYGVHGGRFTLKDHIFPLTAINKSLYLPLPVVGSLYPIMRKSFTGPEDLHHPLYKEMIRKIDNVFDSFPNLIHVAGHERGLQLIKTEQLQVVSGSGSRSKSAIQKKNSLFAKAAPGYVIVDVLKTNDTRFTYYTFKDGDTKVAFTYTQSFKDVKVQEELAYAALKADSIEVSAYAPYDKVSGLHRVFLGENFRKEWAMPAKLPIIRISEIRGGLTPYKRGGGHQTVSLRLKDKNGKEWVLRSIEKYPEVLLPEQVRETFAKDVIRDAMTSQHPYGALAVPVLADAVNVPHANPVIGYVAPDKQLGIYQKIFANRLCLFEEREPSENTDNSATMIKELNEDNDNSVDSTAFLRARLLDLYLGDWDRHQDQWRWYDERKGSSKRYLAIPRDRDQAFYRNQGFLPRVATAKAFAPFLRGFRSDIKKSNEFFIVGQDLDNRFLNQLDHEQWMKVTNEFTAALTDDVLEASLRKLPAPSYNVRHDDLLKRMKNRRDNLAAASEKYYYFLNKIVDIRVSDKNEVVELLDGPDGNLLLVIHKLSKEGKIRDQLYSKTFSKSVTKEIRIFTGKGDDSVIINTRQSSIKLRIVGGDGKKHYNVINSGKKVHVYEKKSNASFTGTTRKLKTHLSDDSTNTAILPTRRYNTTLTHLTGGLNPDDGLLLGVSIRNIRQGFRKLPFASIHQFNIVHAFSTKAYRISYKGEWPGNHGKPDFLLNAVAKAPTNTQNFFGRGNETEFNKTGDYKQYYRTRFTIYQVEPAFRWRGNTGSSFSMGPSLQFYRFDSTDNEGRFITNPDLIGSYDSSTIGQNKRHLGLVLNFTRDKKNKPVLPTWGTYINIRVQGYMGLNTYSKSFVQIIPEFVLYKSLNDARTIILAERFGGGVSFGNTTFYQSLYVGGHENLYGYRQYRFAGQHSFYNNLELRIKLTDFASYILPGQFGITGFFDIGRVWEKNDNSSQWHQGIGGGIYFAPAQLVVLQLIAAYSEEGWYPNFSMGFRF